MIQTSVSELDSSPASEAELLLADTVLSELLIFAGYKLGSHLGKNHIQFASFMSVLETRIEWM